MTLEESTSINNAGQIVGDGAVGSGPLRAFLFDSGTVTDMGVLGGHTGDQTIANAINSAGHAAGFQFGTLNHPFLWDGSLHDLGMLPGYANGTRQWHQRLGLDRRRG